MPAVAFFVSAHGFGHAARAAAVAEALAALRPDLRLEIVSTVPRWFFADSLTVPFAHHRVECDVGLVQRSPLEEDLDATLARLAELLPPRPATVDALARLLARRGCVAAVCDQAPLGLAAARRTGIPSALVESFTWDWIYEAYLAERPGFAPFIADLAELAAGATLRLQTEPVCRAVAGATTVAPVSRTPRDLDGVRARLGIAAKEPFVLVTMGGIPGRWLDLAPLADGPAVLVVPGAALRPIRRGRVLALPHHSGFYHPDLVAAADGVVGKLGYSTVAEAWAAGTPVAFVPRPTFRESPVLAAFARAELGALTVEPASWADGSWCSVLSPLLAEPRRSPRTGGAAAAAAAVARLVA